MFEINSMAHVWAATILVFLLTLTLTAIDIFLLFPPELAMFVMSRATVSTMIIALPIGRWFFGKMLEKNQISAELRRLVERDRLTDVATRDFFFDRLTHEPDAFGVSLMVDIDHFKKVNDTHGHLVGDKVIRSVAKIMSDQIRDQDIVCRFGGEEFVIFLHQSTSDEGWAIAERIRLKISEAKTITDDGSIQVTVSVGGSLKERIEHVDEAIKRADACLYRAKARGRNRTVVDWSNSNQIAPISRIAGRPGVSRVNLAEASPLKRARIAE